MSWSSAALSFLHLFLVICKSLTWQKKDQHRRGIGFQPEVSTSKAAFELAYALTDVIPSSAILEELDEIVYCFCGIYVGKEVAEGNLINLISGED
jgi:hypothetical protein